MYIAVIVLACLFSLYHTDMYAQSSETGVKQSGAYTPDSSVRASAQDSVSPMLANQVIAPVDASHSNRKHITYFNDVQPGQTLFWKSFPVVDSITVNPSYGACNNEIAAMFGEYIPANGDLQGISWSYKSQYGYTSVENNWANTDYAVTPAKGFKFRFESPPATQVEVDGLLADPATTPIELGTGSNLIGYFVEYTQDVATAFGRHIPGTTNTYLDYVYKIEARDWSACRESDSLNSPWIVSPDRYTLSCGDAVDVYLIDGAPAQMYWNCGIDAKPYQRQKPQHFAYTEALEYQPVFIELEPGSLPAEVGLFINGICYGASIVDSSLVEVHLYPAGSRESSQEVQLAYYYPDKSNTAQQPYKLYDAVLNQYTPGKLFTGKIKSYAYLSCRKG